MHIGVLTLNFHLPGCNSLKQKRQRLSGLKDRFGRLSNIAATEAEHHDTHQRSQWVFVSVGQGQQQTRQALIDIEDYAAHQLDAVVTDRQLEWL